MGKIPVNDPCPCRSGKKYKKCCLQKDEAKARIAGIKNKLDTKKITKKDLLMNPFTNCPNCNCKKTYGLSLLHSSNKYTKECYKCGYSQSYPLPPIKKKVIYLDQFVISNLVKLLDPSHPSHQEIKKDPFWEKLFIKLEKLQDTNLIICPDTFYHRDESIAGNIPFYLMERLYEHFSDGKTLLPHLEVYRQQISLRFEQWLKGEPITNWAFNPLEIAWEDFNEWAFGLRVSVSNRPREGERQKLLLTNEEVKKRLMELWTEWASEQSTTYKERVNRELLGLKKLLIESALQHKNKQAELLESIERGEEVTEELALNLLPPLTNDIVDDLIYKARKQGVPQNEIHSKIDTFLNDPKVLIQIPSLKISSLMYAGFAHRANRSGQKRPPKSFNDVYFISAYLPYCDAMFIDNECATILGNVPRDLPKEYKLTYPTKIFSLNSSDDFLNYLDDIYKSASPEHMEVVKELSGDDNLPYWDILIQEKAEKELEAEEEEDSAQSPNRH